MSPSRTLSICLSISIATMLSGPAFGELTATFADPAWNGDKVPEGQQCQKFGGTGGSPALELAGVPGNANAIVLEFSDRSYQPMDNGGHGKLGFEIEPGEGKVSVPSAPAHTTVLPAGFFTVEEHQAPNWDKAGTYLPPCSGGRGNEYYVTIKAVHREGDEHHLLAETKLEMGKY